MKKYILYSFLTIFAFFDVSFGMLKKEGEGDSSPGVLKIKVNVISWKHLLEAGRLDGLSPQAHLNPDKAYDPPKHFSSKGGTFYVPADKLSNTLVEKEREIPQKLLSRVRELSNLPSRSKLSSDEQSDRPNRTKAFYIPTDKFPKLFWELE